MTRAPHLVPQDSVSDSISQDEIVENHNHLSSGAPGNLPPGSVGEETFVVPASLEQGRYWTLAQIDPGSTASNMAISFELAGPLDPLLVEQAIAALTLRHEALRTVFRIVDGHLTQVILTRPLYEFTQQDLTRDDSVVPQAELAAVLSAHSHVSIDLEHGPVLRARLLRLASERHVLALTMSHIVCDGWSNGLLVRDLMKIYHALRTGDGPLEEVAAGPASGLPTLPFQFADFTIWQNEYLATERATDALHFWTSHIPRDLPALDMPADHPRQAGRRLLPQERIHQAHRAARGLRGALRALQRTAQVPARLDHCQPHPAWHGGDRRALRESANHRRQRRRRSHIP
jgi:hypothetical protein